MEKSKIYSAHCVDIDGLHTIKFVVAMSLPQAVAILVDCESIDEIINIEQLADHFNGVLN